MHGTWREIGHRATWSPECRARQMLPPVGSIALVARSELGRLDCAHRYLPVSGAHLFFRVPHTRPRFALPNTTGPIARALALLHRRQRFTRQRPMTTSAGYWPKLYRRHARSRYAPLDQIDAHTSAHSKSRGGSRQTPSSPSRFKLRRRADGASAFLFLRPAAPARAVFALDAAPARSVCTSRKEGERGAASPRPLSLPRPVAYWVARAR